MGNRKPDLGLSFPFRFQRRTGSPQLSTFTRENHERIKESILQILGTRIGERLMRPDFGSRLHELVFESNDAVLRGLIRHHVADAIKRWEKRVTVTGVTFDGATDLTDTNVLLVIISYTVNFSRSIDSVVFPFHRE